MLEFTPFLIGSALALFLAALVAVFQFIPIRIWFGGIALSAIPQIYLLPVAGVYPSISLLSSLGPVFSWRHLSEFWELPWFKAFVALFLVHALSLVWSPFPISGFRHLVYLLPFPLAAAIGLLADRVNRSLAGRIVAVALAMSALQALLVMVFRVAPSIEGAFWGSRLATFAISPNVLGALFDGSPNNVFDPAKAGGLFVNANTAAAMMGFCSIVAWKLREVVYRRALMIVALLNWVAVFFTGSKAGMIVAVLIAVFSVMMDYRNGEKLSLKSAVAFVFVALVVLSVVPFAIEHLFDTGFVGETSDTLDVRKLIWAFALDEFLRAPVQGLGFGGWENAFPFYALAHRINPGFPPHNAFIIAWSQSGLFAAIALLAFITAFLRWAFIAAQSSNQRERCLGSALFLGCLWFWAQSLGENFGVLGEQHFTPLLGLLAGLLFGAKQAPTSA